MSVEFVEESAQRARIRVLGVGGCGGNVVKDLVASELPGVEYAAINTDAQALAGVEGAERLQIGREMTQGLGAGAKPEVARDAATQEIPRIKSLCEGSHMVFITAGMGKGTGTGASPVVAQAARDCGALTVAVVTRPFRMERRDRLADQGIAELAKHVDSLIVVPNQKLHEEMEKGVTLREAFAASNRVLYNAVAGITEVITKPGEVNLDYNDVRSVMGEMGMAVIGSAVEEGADRANRAALAAIRCPLMEDIDLAGARGLLINISASPENLALNESEQVVETIQDHMGFKDENAFCGVVYDDSLGESLRVTVVVTGVERVGGAHDIQVVPAETGGPNVFQSGRRAKLLDQIREAENGDEAKVPAILRRQVS